MGDLYFDNSEILNFELVDDSTNFFNASRILNFELINNIIKFFNVSRILSFEIRSYHEGFVIYKVVLDFLDDMGGIF